MSRFSLPFRLPPDLVAGARSVAPLFLGLLPFGVVTGVAAINAGLSPVQAVGLSVVVFAGASQLAAVDLLAKDAPLAVVVLTAAVINLRMTMYSASIAPHLSSIRRGWRETCAYLLTDMSYALAIAEFTESDERNRRWYYLGAAGTIWGIWQVATIAGVVIGARIPPRWDVGFAVPLVFLSLVVPRLTDRPRLAAALVGGGVAVAGAGLPLNLGLLTGALTGVLAGVVVDRGVAS